MRRAAGLVLYVGGGLLLSFAAGRYGVGAVRADEARAAWNDSEAQAAVALARSVALHHGRREPLVDGAPVARLVIPKLDFDAIVLEGVDGDDLNAGPGHLPGSAFPGEPGNAIISAHRDRHFNHLDALDVGDTIYTESGARRNAWVVVATRVIDKDAPALFHTKDATLTLTTCWPIRYLGPAPDRLIVTAKPIVTHAPSRA
ncbi:MAG TPA: class D sortase [Gemmatimonadaceae bacterium]|nr:class D sortase [Gemmatimonadaceae bacterium]